MAAETAPTVVDGGTAVGAVEAHVLEEDVVVPEGLAKAVDMLVEEPLLPVEPPEIDAFLLADTDDVVEHGFVEIVVLEFPGDGLALGRVAAEVAAEDIVELLVVVDTIGRMEVEGHAQAVLVHPGDEPFGVGDQFLVPRPACPTSRMPVHIENHDVERNLIALDVSHNLHELALGVSPIAAVPIAEQVGGREGDASSHTDKVAKCGRVVVAITQKVPVVGT